MNEKLSLQDLVDLLSKKAKITKKDADSFYRELFQLVLERIFDNDLVKIKDFGTFKLISVSSRESVNVNTGEKIEIPSHYKLSFIPDKILKNLVNKPFSQFETILLEDGVVFETSVDNDEDVNEDEIIENAELDLQDEDDDIVAETEKPIVVEPISVIPNIKPEVKEKHTLDTDTEKPKVSKSEPSANQIYPRSFVYSYTTSASDEKSGSITLTVPKSELVGAVNASKIEKETSIKETLTPEIASQEILAKKEFPIELKDLPDVSSIDEDVVADLEEEITILNETNEGEFVNSSQIEDESEKIQPEPEIEKVEELSDSSSKDEVLSAIPLSKNITANNLESDLDSEIETEEDVIIPVPIAEKVVKEEIQEEQSIVEKSPEKESKPAFSNEDPERPLFPIEEEGHTADNVNFIPLIKAGNKETEPVDDEKVADEPANVHGYAGNNKPTEIRRVSFSDTIDPVDIQYRDYNSPGVNSKFRRWLPVIIFLVVIVGFLTYGLVKMLRKPYDFEYNLGRTNLSLTDTLPFIEEASPQNKATNALLDSMKKVQSDLVEDTVKPMKQEPIVPIAQVPAVKQEVESVKSSIVGNADSATTNLINSEKNSFVISDRLQFAILDKAEYHLLKYYSANKEESSIASSGQAKPDAKASVASKSQYATIKRGTTLRTMAATYYGNPDYWVYIYQTNKKNIANPNNVPVGTTLVIPPLSDYGVSNPKDANAIQTAKNLETKILRQR